MSTLPFLDVEIKFVADNIETWVFRKKSNTNVLLNFTALAPTQWKRSLILCLLHRAKLICSSDNLFNKEVSKLRSIFLSNSYPLHFFNRVLQRFSDSLASPDDESASSGGSEQSVELTVYLQLPYVGQTSLLLGKRLSELVRDKLGIEIEVVYSTFKVGAYFGLKSQTPCLFRSNLVYHYSCFRDESTSYIGMTTKQYFVRIDNHFDSTKKSAVRSHLSQCRGCFEAVPRSRNFKVLKWCSSTRETEITEAMLIRKYKPRLNIQLGAFQGSSFLLRVFK